MRLYKLFLLLLIFLFMPYSYGVEDVIYPDFSEGDKLRAFVEQDNLFQFDKRKILEDKGINLQSSYITNSFVMSNSNKKSSKGTYQGLYNLSLELDFEKLNLYKGGKLYALYQMGNRGINSMEFMGSYSDISSYDPMKSINQISELYYEQSFKDDLFNLKIGKQDANIDFQALDSGFEFLNLSFSFMPNTPLPLFPSQQTGVRGRIKIKDSLYLQNGFYDGNLEIGSGPKSFFTGKNHYLDIIEAYKLTDFKGLEGKYMTGAFYKTGKYENLETKELKRNNYGAYFGFEQGILKNKMGVLNIFGQFSYVRKNLNEVPYYYSLGLLQKGINEERSDDFIGLAFNWHQFDKTLKRLENKTSEKTVEFFYKIKLTNFFYIQPDIQYIIRPSGNMKNSLVLGLRTIINF